ncbi:hypothetical protein RhiirA1_481144 [Rhizophagus irregularis]|uniref:Uncharacterized protein n=1 Tax=Rhizophagus irregularis TaxID=588596 RepID=A0A2N0QNI3_9GLOM|nr:hypothetical protein RhiirA1_481144 [Rhizophagus irregularis]
MTDYKDWFKVAEAQGSICVWDEAYLAFSNRKWSKYGQSVLTDSSTDRRSINNS